jgi:ketol-acid reductoisomerase
VTAAKVYFEPDLDTSILTGKQIGIIGYGSQGRAQALNLRDGGFAPQIGVRPGKSREQACADGFAPIGVAETCRACDILVLLVPDEAQPSLCRESIFPNVGEGAFIGFATGFCVHFGLIAPPEGTRLFLAAPKGPGDTLRKRFTAGGGIPALVASLEGDREGLAVARAYAKAIGCGRAGVIETTFREEAVADLFGEQCVLVGGLAELMKTAFDVLVARGYSPEVAYIECIQEVEYMAALISKVGLASLKDKISSTAYYGGATRGGRVIDPDVRRRLGLILDEIENGEFGREFLRYIGTGGHKELAAPDTAMIERARSNLRGS